MYVHSIQAVGLFLLSTVLLAQGDEWRQIGKVKPRLSSEIASSNWSIGGETMDRDYTDFNEWKEYLGATGAKKVSYKPAGQNANQKKENTISSGWMKSSMNVFGRG